MATTTKEEQKKRAPHKIKQLMRKEIERKFQPLDGGVFVGYRGLDSEKIYDLRKKLHAKGVKLNVIKNAVALRAFETLGYPEAEVTKILQGPIAVVYAKDAKAGGMIGAAKAIYDWKTLAKDKIVEIKGGFFKGDVISEKEVKALKDLPSREQLLGMVAGAFQAPIAGLANCFYQSISKFAGAIAAVEEKKKKG